MKLSPLPGVIAFFTVFAALPAFIYFQAGIFTDEFFRERLIPLPSEKFAEAMGLTAAFTWLFVVTALCAVFQKRRTKQ